MNLKSDLEEKFKQVEASKTKEGKGQNKDPQNPKNTTAKANAQTKQMLNQLGHDGKPILPPSLATPIPLGHQAGMGYRRVTVNSIERLTTNEQVDTDAKPNYLMLNYQFTRDWVKGSPWIFMLRTTIGRTLNKLEQDLGPYLNAGGFQAFTIPSWGIMPYVGIELDTLSFISLPERGEGLKAGNAQIYFWTLGSYIQMELFKQKMVLMPQFSMGMMTKSGYPTIQEGSGPSSNRISLAVQFMNVYKKVNLELNYYQLNFEVAGAQDLTTSASGTGLNVFLYF